MRYEILGPLRVVRDDTGATISARKIETVLMVLLLRADRVVASDTLMNEIWGDELPRRVTACLHVYISQLRKFLQRPGRKDNPVVTQPSGYLLRLGEDELDLNDFLTLMDGGRELAREGRHEQAARRFDKALRLWRGPFPGELYKGPAISGFVTWLTEERLECLERLVESQLALGRHREVVGQLYRLIAENPLREAFYRQLMLALYRSERQGDALKTYQNARQMLREELGVEPCRSLRDLQRDILAADDRLYVPAI
ncbi:AfsR/SARP family transcriptional regulator [Streptomyces sp. NPDC047315]|uniref:AfsR/SARP family transcriptional regulator n=1 Tax=Streptomyces sp. NPDC047315 TaxID=3155142 RepID=UPI0033C03165